MTQQPARPASMRGAVDLSALGAPAPAEGGLVVEGTDAGFQQIVSDSRDVLAVVVLWSSTVPASKQYVDVVAGVAGEYAGRFRVVSVDIETNPGLRQAFQVESVPTTYGLIAGQPVGLFAGVQPAEQLRPLVDQLLSAAVQNGVTGRIETTGTGPAGAPIEPPLPPLHQEAFDAIESGDLEAAARAYEKALKENPADDEAKVGLAHVQLIRRTDGVDLAAARADADANPDDIDAALLLADLDVLDGRVEEAFDRLVALVRRTVDDQRNRVRQHLVDLYDIVGGQDERVLKSRRALMSALF